MVATRPPAGRALAELDAARWREVGDLLEAVLGEPPAQRHRRLAKLCPGDPALRREVESLLEVDEDLVALFDRPIAPTSPAGERDPLIGQRLGPCEIVAPIGGGGFASVYRAKRRAPGEESTVAVKVLNACFVHHLEGWPRQLIQDRFCEEWLAMRRLRHPHIVPAMETGKTACGRPFFAMEFIDGLPLDTYCASRRSSPPDRWRLFVTVCEAVAYAHDRGILHLDLKPTNVLVDRSGKPHLVDFGAASPRLSDPSCSRVLLQFVTPFFASPEQIRGRPLDARSDVFSLGVLAYYLLAGSHPFPLRSRSLDGLRETFLREKPRRLGTLVEAGGGTRSSEAGCLVAGPTSPLSSSVAAPVEALLLQAVQVEPDHRPPSAGALLEGLRQASLPTGRRVLASLAP